MKHLFKLIILVFFIDSSSVLLAQKQGNIWYFGRQAGLDFNGGSPVALTNSRMSQEEGCASISNNKGELLFYTSGSTAWDSTHTFMPNGTGMRGSYTSSMSGMIAPMIGQPGKYYIFSVDGWSAGSYRGLFYSEVDMALPGNGSISEPLGDVITGRKNINLVDSMTEKVIAVPHANGEDYWVLGQRQTNRDMYAFLVTSAGINPVPVRSSIQTTTSGGLGCMAASHDGKTILYTSYDNVTRSRNFVQMIELDLATGLIISSNTISTVDQPYGVEFSPNDSLMYVCAKGIIQQFKRFDSDIISTKKEYPKTNSTQVGALQVGPDGKMYLAEFGKKFLTVFNDPNSYDDPQIVWEGVDLDGMISTHGLPNIYYKTELEADFFADTVCLGDTTYFSDLSSGNPEEWIWNFGDPNSGNNNNDTIQNTYHIYQSPGSYFVSLVIANSKSSSKGPDSVMKQVVVKDEPMPQVTKQCFGTDIILTPSGGTSYVWSDGSSADSLIVNPSLQSSYTVSVTGANACKKDLVIDVELCDTLFIPNVFTPNKDNINDEFTILAIGMKDYNILIYNRWGEKVFESSSPSIHWNGLDLSGKEVPEGVYYYVLKATSNNAKEYDETGNVTMYK